jgi:hypothetical protein
VGGLSRGLGPIASNPDGTTRQTTAYGRRLVLAALTLHAWGVAGILWPPEATCWDEADKRWTTQLFALLDELDRIQRDRPADEVVA